MNLLELVQASTTQPIGRVNPDIDESQLTENYASYVASTKERDTHLISMPDVSDLRSSVVPGPDPDPRTVVPSDDAIQNPEDTRASSDWSTYRESSSSTDNEKPQAGFVGYAVKADDGSDLAAGVSPGDDTGMKQSKIWAQYAQNLKDSASSLAKNFESKSGHEIYRKKVHINTNVKMVGFAPNPQMLAEAQGSGLRELTSGVQKMLTGALSSVAGMNETAATAMSWLNWVCPSSAYILPPGISWAWNKLGYVRGMMPPGMPSDASLGSSLGTAVNTAISFAENFNLGYNKALIALAERTQEPPAKAPDEKVFGRKVSTLEASRIALRQDCENGQRANNMILGATATNKVFHYGVRQQGSDFTGAVLREKRQEAALGLNKLKTTGTYDQYTFYEFSYPLKSSVTNDYFQGIFTNIDFAAGKHPKLDFLIHRPPRFAGTGLPEFSYVDRRLPSGEVVMKDISRISTITNDDMSILGWEAQDRGTGGIKQGKFAEFNTHRIISKHPDVFTMDVIETENFDVYQWMAAYYRYYYYQEGRKVDMNPGYYTTFMNDQVHRSPYECYYYLELMYMLSFKPEFRHAIYMVVPIFDFKVTTEDREAEQRHKIDWKVIGQVKTESWRGDDASQQQDNAGRNVTLNRGADVQMTEQEQRESMIDMAGDLGNASNVSQDGATSSVTATEQAETESSISSSYADYERQFGSL